MISLINAICQTYQLGKCVTPPKPCSGGLLHRIWHIETAQGQFIIKLLNPAIINRPDTANCYRVTEQIAQALSKRISAVTALTLQNDPLFYFNNQVVMVFPYLNATTVTQGAVTLDKAAQIGKALAQIHMTNIRVENVPDIDVLSTNILFNLLNSDKQKEALAKKCAAINTGIHTKMNSANISKGIKNTLHNSELINSTDVVNQLLDCYPLIKDIQENYQKYAKTLKNNLVISHRDCDPKNVLWDNDNNYYIIDWESAGLINKTKDLLATAIYWSFDDRYLINLDRLLTFLNVYQENQGLINHEEITAGLYGLLNDWVSWLDFNASRLLNNSVESEEFRLGKAEAIKTLTALPVLLAQLPKILTAVMQI